MVQRLMQQLLESDKYAERRGAAYGLAGLVKGLGILSLKQQEMMAALTDAIQDKKNFRRREGECLLGPEAARGGLWPFLPLRGAGVCTTEGQLCVTHFIWALLLWPGLA